MSSLEGFRHFTPPVRLAAEYACGNAPGGSAYIVAGID